MAVFAPQYLDPSAEVIIARDQIVNGILHDVTYAFMGSDYSSNDSEDASETELFNPAGGYWDSAARHYIYHGIPPGGGSANYNHLNFNNFMDQVDANGGRMAWRVRTTSNYYNTEWSPWSGEAYFTIIPRPINPAFNAPGSGQVLHQANYNITLTWTQAGHDWGYEAKIFNSAGALEWQSGQVNSPGSGTRSITATLQTLGSKRVEMRVANTRNGKVLWSNTSGRYNTEGQWSQRSFSTIPQSPNVASPTEGLQFYENSLLVDWGTTPLQEAYEVRVMNGTTQEWTSNIVTGTTKTHVVPFPNIGSRTVEVRVRKDNVWSNYKVRNVTRLQADAPTITAPANGTSFAETTRTLSWTAPNQQSYEARVVNASGGVEWTSGVVANASTRSVTASFPNLGAHTVDVRVLYDGVWSNRTSVSVTRTIPNPPTISSPAAGAVFTTNAQTLNWSAALQEGYEARIINASGGVEWTSGDVTSTTRTRDLSFPLEGSKTIDLRVRYAGVWSNPTTVTVSRISPPTPTITAPSSNTAFATVGQTVNWTSSRQQVYELRILHGSTGALEWSSGEVASTAVSRFISFPNLGTKIIDLRVRDESVWSPRTQVTGIYVSPTPTITSLTGGIVAAANETLIGNHSTTFENDDYQAAVKSRWRIIGAASWTEGAAQSGGQNFYTYPTTLTVGDYERQVAVSLNNTGEWSPWSASGQFTIFVRPPMPAIVVPVPNTVVADRVNVTWTAPSQDAYEIQVRNGNAIEWSSGVVVVSAARTAEVLFPSIGDRQVFLRVRNNTLWSNEGSGRTWTTLPVTVVATPVTSLDRVIDPFVAASLGYSTVNLTWTPPLAESWTGYRIVRSRSGYPTTANDGVVAVEVLDGSWASQTGYANTGLLGGWHYYTFFLRSATTGTWVRVATTDVLVPYDYGSSDKLWDTIPEYYKHIRDDSADQSTKNLRINPELYLSNDYTAPNLLLAKYLQLFGIGFDFVRTQAEQVAGGYDPNSTHISRLNLLARQFGRDLEQAVPSHANRTVVRSLAYLYRKRGTLDGIEELATMTTGYDVEVNLGPNQMLNEDQAAFANPQYEQWDAARYYTPGIRVEYGSYVYQNALASSGQAQAPANSGVNNTWWNVVLAVSDRSLARADTGDVSTWQVTLDPGGTLSGKTAIAVGVQEPTDALMFQSNALVIERTDANGATSMTVRSTPVTAAAGQTLDAKRQVLEAGIPLPQPTPHVADKEYEAGSLVRYNTYVYEAKVDTTALPTAVSAWKQVSAANAAPRQRLSVYAHGPFTGTAGTGARAITMLVHQYDADGTFISTLSGIDVATNTAGVGGAWNRAYYTFTPVSNARYLAVAAQVAAPALNEKQYFTNWMLERPEISSTTPSVYSKAREVQVTVKSDLANLVPNPSFENDLASWSGANATIARTNTWAAAGSQSLSVTPSGESIDSYATLNSNILVNPGKTYYVRGTIRLTATQINSLDSRARRIVLYGYNGATLVNTALTTDAAPNAVGTFLVSGFYTVPESGVDRVAFRIYNGASTGGGVVEWDAIMMVESPTAVEYFDGGTSTDHMWEGTPHNSRSHYYENLLEREPALTRALVDSVPLGIGVGRPKFGTSG